MVRRVARRPGGRGRLGHTHRDASLDSVCSRDGTCPTRCHACSRLSDLRSIEGSGLIALPRPQDIGSTAAKRKRGLSGDQPPPFTLPQRDHEERGPRPVIGAVGTAEAVSSRDDRGRRRKHSDSLCFDTHDRPDQAAAGTGKVLSKFRTADQRHRCARRDKLDVRRIVLQKRIQIAGAELPCNLRNHEIGGSGAGRRHRDCGAADQHG